MTVTLTATNDLIQVSPPAPQVITLAPPDTSTGLAVLTPPVPVQVTKGPPVPGVGLVVPVAGQDGHDGAPGAPGDVVDPELLDLTTLFENGLL